MATADELLSELNIKIIGVGLVQNSVPMTTMLLDVVQRAASYTSNAKQITITVMEPQRDGSIEYAMQVEYVGDNGSIYICCLRREPGATTEFHS